MTQHFQIDPTTAADDLHALLRLVANPDAHKARLSELVEQQKLTDEKIAAHHELTAKTRGLHSAAEAEMIVVNNRKTALDAREAALEERAKELATAEAMRSDTALRRREHAVAAREEEQHREADRLAALRTEYEQKLAKLKNLASALEGTR